MKNQKQMPESQEKKRMLRNTTAWGLTVHSPFIYSNQPGAFAEFLPVMP
jgi:hypothetical protein